MPDIICQNCGSINDFHTIMKSNQNTAWCNGCDKFIKNISQGKPPVIHFGKYKGRLISTMVLKDEIQYLEWLNSQEWATSVIKGQIANHFENLKNV